MGKVISLNKVRASKTLNKQIEHFTEQLKELEETLMNTGYPMRTKPLDASSVSVVLFEEFDEVGSSINNKKLQNLFSTAIAKTSIRLLCSLTKEETDKLFVALNKPDK